MSRKRKQIPPFSHFVAIAFTLRGEYFTVPTYMRGELSMRIPTDVQAVVREVFSDCNSRVSAKLTKIPNIHETSLDHTFIEHFTHHCCPVHTASDWTIRFDCHFIGGGRHYMRWEVADFGILVVFRHKGEVLKSKVTLLQSKRLFPSEYTGVETNPLDVDLGFNFLFQPDDLWAELMAPRSFRFDDNALYRSLAIGDEQFQNIAKYESRHKIPVHYLLYNPLKVPATVSFPLSDSSQPGECEVGCRVVPSTVMRTMANNRTTERPPSFLEVRSKLEGRFARGASKGGWRIEDYIVDQLIACKDGLVDETPQFTHLMHIFGQKSQPIHAALVITFDMPSP